MSNEYSQEVQILRSGRGRGRTDSKSLQSSKCKKSGAQVQEKTASKFECQGESSDLSGHRGYRHLFAHQPWNFGGTSLDCTFLVPSNVDLRSKTASYITNKMCLFGNSKGIAI